MFSVISFILKNLDHFRRRFWAVGLAGFLDGVAGFVVPVLLAEFTRGALTKDRLIHLIPLIGIVYAFGLLTSWIIRKYGEALSAQFQNHIRLKYFKILEHLQPEVLQKYHSGYVLSLINKIGFSVEQTIFGFFWNATRILATLVLFFIFTARESFSVALMNLLVLGVFLVVGVYLSRKIVPLAEQNNRDNASLLESFADFITNLVTVKKLGVYKFAETRLERKTGTSDQSITRLQNFHALRWSIMHTLFGITYIGTLAIFLYFVAISRMPASALILFISAYYILFLNLNRLTELMKGMLEVKAYVITLEEILGQGAPADASLPRPVAWREISFREISFQYPNTEKQIEIPEFHIQPGEKVAVTGVSGLGKTTFLNLLNNFLKPNAGQRLVDGQLYEKVNQAFFDGAMVIISQEIELFNLSLRENITLGKTLPDELISNILERLNLSQWVSHLHNGLDTIVGEKGVRLSAGQKQRINLIRGLLLERDMYLLDEPTSHLDAATEEKAVEFLRESLRDKTAVIVTHRPALLALCSRQYDFSGHTLVAKTA